MKKIVILGATGVLGRLTAERLLARSDAKAVRLVLAGRHRNELERLSMEMGRKYRQAVDIGVVDVTDRTALRSLVDGAAVVLNCAAPYATSGAPVLAAAVTSKVHLIDASNEMLHHEQCGQRAAQVKEAGIAVINGLAVAPGVADIAAAEASRGWEPLTGVRVLHVQHDLEESPGLRASTLENLKQPCRAWVERALQPLKIASSKHEFKWSGGAARGKNVPGAEAVVISRSAPDVRNVTTYRPLDGKSGMLLSMLGGPLASVGMLMIDKWARGGERPAVDRSRFIVIIELEGAKSRRFAIVQSEGVYEKTAALLSEASMRLANDGPRLTGLVTPAQLFATTGLLAAAGLEIQIADAAPV